MTENRKVRLPPPDRPSTPETHPTPPVFIPVLTLEDRKQHKLAALNSLAGTLILKHYPEYKQRNDLTDEPTTKSESRKQWLTDMRAEANRKEAAINAVASDAELDAIDIRAGWPTPTF